MSSRRHGNRMVSDLSHAILLLIKTSPVSVDEVVGTLQVLFGRQVVAKRVSDLKYQGSLKTNNKHKLQLTTKGLAALETLRIPNIKQPKSWDGYWRVVIYDIPENQRQARNKIRDLLKKLGFMQVQISVWTHPLPCLEEFRTIQRAYGIEKHLLLLEVRHQQDFEKLRNTFAARYSVMTKISQ